MFRSYGVVLWCYLKSIIIIIIIILLLWEFFTPAPADGFH